MPRAAACSRVVTDSCCGCIASGYSTSRPYELPAIVLGLLSSAKTCTNRRSLRIDFRLAPKNCRSPLLERIEKKQ